jgi:hypothetical protein
MSLLVAKLDPIGWSDTHLSDQTALEYAEVARLAEAITIVRRGSQRPPGRRLSLDPFPGRVAPHMCRNRR